MNWIDDLNRAMGYIEENLTGEINLAKVCKAGSMLAVPPAAHVSLHDGYDAAGLHQAPPHVDGRA